MAIALTTTTLQAAWQGWLLNDVLIRLFVGAAVGLLSGWCLGLPAFRPPSLELPKTGDGLVAVGVTLISYGATEMLGGYGFLAVFVATMTLPATDRCHGRHILVDLLFLLLIGPLAGWISLAWSPLPAVSPRALFMNQ